jgi:hypothetical protein
LRQGTYYHRALAFKAVADSVFGLVDRKPGESDEGDQRLLGCKVALTRGEYGRAWNTVMVKAVELEAKTITREEMLAASVSMRDEPYVIDLMHNVGQLIKVGTPEANAYQRI